MKIDLEAIAARSLINCHTKGVDSLLLDDAPERRIRAFIAYPGHDLWKNGNQYAEPMSIAIHPHHCDITMIPIYGRVYNVEPTGMPGWAVKLNAYHYESPITGKQGKFVRLGFKGVMTLSATELKAPIHMKADQKHSIFIPRGETAAWFVCEGKENPHYRPICYSNADLEKFDFTDLYKPMTAHDVETRLNKIRYSDGWLSDIFNWSKFYQ